MTTQSIILTICAGFVAFGLLLFLAQFLSRKLRVNSETETGIKPSFAINVGSIIIFGCILFAKALPMIPEGFGVQWRQYSESFVLDAFQFTATIIGFTFLWIVVQYYISNTLLPILLGKRDEVIEMERDNFSFFLIKAFLLIGLSMMFSNALEDFLRLFMPVLDIPFYH